MSNAVPASSSSADALKKLDDSGITAFHWKILLVSGMGFFTDAYDLFIIGVVITILKPLWKVSTLDVSLVNSTALIAAAVGAILFGRIADMFGRKRIYGYEVLVLAAGAVASALSPNVGFLIAFRFILGVGIGGDYPVSATIMSEYAGKLHRGLLISLVFAAQAAGLIVGPLIAAGLLATGLPHDLIWRIMLALGAIPGLSVYYLRRQIQETPRYALAMGQHDEFDRAASNITGGAHKSSEAAPAQGGRKVSAVEGYKKIISNKRLLSWVVGASISWFLLDFAYYGNTVSSPLILTTLDPGKNLLTDTLLQLAIFAVAAVPGYFVAALTMDRLGRKTIQVMGFVLMAVAFGAIGLVPGISKLVVPFLILYGLSYFFTEFGPNTTTFVYPAEIFPVLIRTTSNGIAASMGKIGGFIGVFTFPLLLSSHGLAGAELVAAAVSLVGAVATWFLLPEPKGKSLEELSPEEENEDAAPARGGPAPALA